MEDATEIAIAESDAEIAACFPVMVQLRTRLRADEFVARVRRQEAEGYRIAVLRVGDRPAAVAGFRIGNNLAWGRFLYVDDLVTAAEARSRGHGAALLRWLADHAASRSCDMLHLDSGVHRRDAHRFYLREGLELGSYHFGRSLATRKAREPRSPRAPAGR